MTTTQLPRRQSKLDGSRLAAAPAFERVALEVQCKPAADMSPLANRIRALMNLTAGGPTNLPLGGRYFDAVVTANGPAAYGVVTLMDEIQRGPHDRPDACGPVIEDPQRGWLIWLVPPETSKQWERLPHRFAVCLGAPHELALPPLDRTAPPGPYWLRRCRSDRLVPAEPLRQYLDQFRPDPVPHEAVLGSMLRAMS
ncbi:hypothetical protein [Streptomyces griseosporeus]|uniref:hypothetical protein n=1 Tax=Streptomyces griseosporeus TaxID=1910 RepID=UPI00378858C7